MMLRILMHIIQSRQVAPLIGKKSFAIILPQTRPARLVLPPLQLFCRQAVQLLQHSTQRLRSAFSSWTVSHQVIMIREHGPGLQFPIELFHQIEQRLLKPIPDRVVGKKARPMSRARRHEVNSRFAEPVRRRVRPIASSFGRFLLCREVGFCSAGHPGNSDRELAVEEKIIRPAAGCLKESGSRLRTVHVQTVLFAILLASSCAGAAAKPNIVFVLADDLGYGDVSAYNPESKIETPNIDRLAGEGMRFTDAHAGGSVCVPSRYALLTGRFAVRAKLNVRNGPVIEEDRMTITSMLRDNGYTTAMVGKWHQGFETLTGNSTELFDYSKPLRGGPMDRGFDSYFGMHASLDIPPYFYVRGRTPTMPPTDAVEASASIGSPEGWNHIQGAFWRAGLVGPDFKHDEVTPRFAEEAMDVIQSYGAGDKEKPLFLYLALPSPHTPWLPVEEFRGKSGAGIYGDFVLQVDDVVGQVMGALEEAGLSEDTLVIFTSDNGPVWYQENLEKFGHNAAGELRGRKGNSWEGGHRMPFIVRWPGLVPADSVSRQTIVFSDVFATFAELSGQDEIPQGMAEDSVSFLPYLRDALKKPGRRDPIAHDRWTLRDGDWKLILPRNRRALGGKDSKKVAGELYNLREDLAEQHNRISEAPERARRMRAQLEAILAPSA